MKDNPFADMMNNISQVRCIYHFDVHICQPVSYPFAIVAARKFGSSHLER